MRKAFTFIDLSIIITILSIILTSSLVIKEKLIEHKKNIETENRIITIKNSLANYYRVNDTLPCPYDLNKNIYEILSDKKTHTSPKSSSSDILTENDGYQNCLGDAKEFIYGAVPINELGLNPLFAFDAWNNKFSYIISSHFVESKNTYYFLSRDDNLQCWIDLSYPSSITIDQNGGISDIKDRLGKDCYFSQLNSEARPKYISEMVNNRAGASFEAENDHLYINNLSNYLNDLIKGYTVFFVLDDIGQDIMFFNTTNTNNQTKESYSINKSRLAIDGSYFNKKDLSNKESGIINKDVNIIAFTRRDFRIKNININFNEQNIIDISPSYNIDLISIGNLTEKPLTEIEDESSRKITIREFLFFNTILPKDRILEIKRYLAKKWDDHYPATNPLLILNSNGKKQSDATFAIISHGSSGSGSFNFFGIQQDKEISRGLDKKNLYSYNRDNIFYTDLYEGIPAKGWQKDFDDILRYSNFLELKTLAGN